MSEKETAQEPGSEPKEKAGRQKQAPVPYFLEISLSLWRLLIVTAGLLTALFSWWNGVDPLMIVFRSGTAVLCLGLLAWITNSLLNRHLLESARRIQRPEQEQEG